MFLSLLANEYQAKQESFEPRFRWITVDNIYTLDSIDYVSCRITNQYSTDDVGIGADPQTLSHPLDYHIGTGRYHKRRGINMIRKILFTMVVISLSATASFAAWGDDPMKSLACSKAGSAYASALQLICGGQSGSVAYNQIINQGISRQTAEMVVDDAITEKKAGRCPREMSQYEYNDAARSYALKCNSR